MKLKKKQKQTNRKEIEKKIYFALLFMFNQLFFFVSLFLFVYLVNYKF